jgi:N-acetylneuraminate synthase
MPKIEIGDRVAGSGEPTFIIAEIGINHNGSVDIAKKLIDLAIKNGCQAVKFQKRTIETVYTADELAKSRVFDDSFIIHAGERAERYGQDPLSPEDRARLAKDPTNTTNGDLKRILEFGLAEYRDIDIYCKEKGIMWTASPWDEASVAFLEAFNMPFYKVGSASLTDAGLLKAIKKTGKPVVLSTGMSTMGQVHKAVALLKGSPVALLHCVSTYPAKDEDLNLRVIKTLQDEFPELVVGYSGHENGSTMAVCAAALGASIIERHITLDRTMPGSDQSASLEHFRLELMTGNIRRLERAFGDGGKRVIPAEVAIQQKLRRVRDF